MEKSREEERQVESLRKEMYLMGQNGRGSFLPTGSSGGEAEHRGTVEQRKAFHEQKRRRALLKAEASKSEASSSKAEGQEEAVEDDEADLAELPETLEQKEEDSSSVPAKAAVVDEPVKSSQGVNRQLAKSCYPEDTVVHGHDQVWGSWFKVEERHWGYACCRSTDHKARCPHAPPELFETALGLPPSKRQRGEPRGPRRGRTKAALLEKNAREAELARAGEGEAELAGEGEGEREGEGEGEVGAPAAQVQNTLGGSATGDEKLADPADAEPTAAGDKSEISQEAEGGAVGAA
ncbi:unnamed protein product [Polarella glacialis]|nr:unnamed protein product [Polarella glacialis]